MKKSKKNFCLTYSLVLSTTLHTIMMAQAAGTAATILDGESVFVNAVTYILSPLYQLAAAIAGIYFLYGVAMFVIDMNNPEKKTFGKSHLLWGMIGMFIIVSIGGILPKINEILGGMFTY